VAPLVTVVLGDVVKVFTADNEGTVHLGGHNGAGQDTTTDGDETSEGALLVFSTVSISSRKKSRVQGIETVGPKMFESMTFFQRK
jgi:hypothetical protein